MCESIPNITFFNMSGFLLLGKFRPSEPRERGVRIHSPGWANGGRWLAPDRASAYQCPDGLGGDPAAQSGGVSFEGPTVASSISPSV